MMELNVGDRVRGTFIQDSPLEADYGCVFPVEGEVLSLDTEAYGGPYVIVDDGSTVFMMDLLEITEVVS